MTEFWDWAFRVAFVVNVPLFYYLGRRSRGWQVDRAKDEAHRWEFAAILAARMSESAQQGWKADLARKEVAIAKLWLENRELRERCGEEVE